MFTGIIQKVGKITNIQNGKGVKSFSVQMKPWLDQVKIGESIAIDGVCLTVKQKNWKSFSVDAIPATLKMTTLKALKIGSKVNLERSLKWGERLGGHYVSGHVDHAGEIVAKKKNGKSSILKIKAARAVQKYLISKGSIAVDGISLTVQKLVPGGFETAIIPHTAKKTTIGLKKAGDFVNLEADLMIKRFLKGKRK